jgi:hypothetical protein
VTWATLLETADRAALAQWGTPVVYTPGNGSPAATVTGIFSNASQIASSDGLQVIGTQPRVFLRLEDLPSDPSSDEPTVTINGTTYTVDNPQVDGEGGVSLTLYRVS